MGSRSIKRRRGVKKRRKLAGGLSVLAIVAAFIGLMGVGAWVMVSSWFEDLPDYKSADAFNVAMPTYVYASDRETVIARLQLEYREPVEIGQIDQKFINAIIAVEDARFYEHSGVDYYGVMRALINNLTGGRLEGASTITQQFVRNTILSGEMDEISIKRKVREAYIATKIEEMYSKDEILLMYLNTVNFGAGAYGVEAAAHRYFSKSASDLTLAEAALLAGLPQSPTYNDPIQYPEHAYDRRNIVLMRMLGEHMITEEEYNQASQEPIELNPTSISDDGIIAYPYFASYVRYLLYNNYDLTEADILKGGLKVYTTLDIAAQDFAEQACADKRASLYDEMEVAMAVVEPNTGYVKALVGGSDYRASEVNLATGQGGGGRPCGSVFKVFTLVTAIKMGIDPNATYVDCTSPATVDGYTLQNINNVSYGTRTVTGALTVSSNTGFVRLITSIGPETVAQTAHEMGITSNLNEGSAYSTLTLGVENVTPLEMANAFATIATGGVRHDLCAITTIEDRYGNVIVDDTDPEARATRVLEPEQARAAIEAMETVVTSGTGTAAALWNGQPVAGKTGTSENYMDITFGGITPQVSAFIWVGDPGNEASVPTGSCAEVFRQFTQAYMDYYGLEPEDFPSAGSPTYAPYDDPDRHIHSYYVYYESEAERAARLKKEEEEKKEEEKKAQSTSSSSSGN
ncbi:MAG: transglycosylase domain-containing protein [Eggerthellaceae bacterium]|nr:transglycosylase domain-containing protein [Eggerthellaceae bacterium]